MFVFRFVFDERRANHDVGSTQRRSCLCLFQKEKKRKCPLNAKIPQNVSKIFSNKLVLRGCPKIRRKTTSCCMFMTYCTHDRIDHSSLKTSYRLVTGIDYRSLSAYRHCHEANDVWYRCNKWSHWKNLNDKTTKLKCILRWAWKLDRRRRHHRHDLVDVWRRLTASCRRLSSSSRIRSSSPPSSCRCPSDRLDGLVLGRRTRELRSPADRWRRRPTYVRVWRRREPVAGWVRRRRSWSSGTEAVSWPSRHRLHARKKEHSICRL